MSDFLPVEDHTCKPETSRHDRAVRLGFAPAARLPNRTVLRPGILKTSLPTRIGNAQNWPKWVGDVQGCQFYRFEDLSLTWTGSAHRMIAGCPAAYHPFDQNALGKMAEQQARGFTSLVSRGGELVKQGAGDPVPGHLVCRTAYQHPQYEVTDQRRYLDANVVPYISIPLAVMLEWKDTWGLLLGSAAAVWDRGRNNRFLAVVGEVDLHGCGGVSKAIWNKMGMGNNDSTWNTVEFHVFTGKPAEGYTLQRWSIPKE